MFRACDKIRDAELEFGRMRLLMRECVLYNG